ncbi:MAG: hypothetical protein WBE37_12415 [Bryobacteraceae bacterium]
MRSNQNPSGSVTPSVGDRSTGARSQATGSAVGKLSVGKLSVGKLSMPRMPVEWLDAGSWRLPSGKALAEFALQAGFLAPLLFRADRFGKKLPDASEFGGSAAGARGKQFGKGDGR